MARRYLSREEARAFYDRIGSWQDWQKFYEGPAMAELLAHGAFETAGAVFELGCGTGAFAESLLAKHLPPTATYLGVDISTTMTDLAGERLARFGSRAEVRQTAGDLYFDLPENSFDRYMANYVLDLLSPGDIAAALAEAYRLLRSGGCLCLVSLTEGISLGSRLLTLVWDRLHRVSPRLVGGCRPLRLLEYLDRSRWLIDYHRVVSAFGLPSEVLIASKRI